MIINNLLLFPEQIFNEVFESIENNSALLLTYVNQNSFNIYFRNEKYKNLLDTKFKVYQADTGIYFLLKFLNLSAGLSADKADKAVKQKIPKIDATSLNTNILNEIIKKKIPVAFIGGKFSERFLKEESIKRKINFAGYHNGYFDEIESANVIRIVNQFNCQVYFVGMGIPKQELFAYELSKVLENKIIICAGNFLEFYFGSNKRAPVYIQKLGFEWLFRLITEPSRLWKRYLLGIPEFIYRAMKYKNT